VGPDDADDDGNGGVDGSFGGSGSDGSGNLGVPVSSGAGRQSGEQRAADENGLAQEFHSESSVAMRSDFRKRISCGVMASFATTRFSGSVSLKES